MDARRLSSRLSETMTTEMRGVGRSGTSGSGVNPPFYAEKVTLNIPAGFIPRGLAAACRETQARAQWLDRLPQVVREIADKWALAEVGAPFDAGCAWVASARMAMGDEVV